MVSQIIGRGGVAHRDAHRSFGSDFADKFHAALLVRGHGDNADDVAVPLDKVKIKVRDVAFLMRPLVGRVDKWALHVDALDDGRVPPFAALSDDGTHGVKNLSRPLQRQGD